MKRAGWVFGLGVGVAVTLGSWVQTAAADTPAHVYVGAGKCKMCHNSPPKGAQYTRWTESKHSKAFANLGGEQAREIGTSKGIADPQKAPECLKCHVTGYGAAADKRTDKSKLEDGVGCESCHGPGGDYLNMDVMKDRAKAAAAGLVDPTEATCKTCHNPENPTDHGFNFAEYRAKIAHPNPQKAKQ